MDLMSKFDVVVCLENIEHIQDDRKLMVDIRMCLKPAGRIAAHDTNPPVPCYRPEPW